MERGQNPRSITTKTGATKMNENEAKVEAKPEFDVCPFCNDLGQIDGQDCIACKMERENPAPK